MARSVIRLLRARAGQAVAVLSVLGVLALLVAAVREPGFAQTPPVPKDRSLWIANADRGLVGRVNPSAAQLDSALPIKGTVTVLQDPATGFVAVLDPFAHELQLIDPATVTIGARIAVPQEPLVELNGGTVAVADRATGRIWTAPQTEFAAADARAGQLRATVGAGAALTVSATGVVHAAAAGSDRLTTIGPAGEVSTSTLPGGPFGADRDAIALTVVGQQVVALDRQFGAVRTADQSWSANQLAGGQLQVPGPAAAEVVVATETGLRVLDLRTGVVSSAADGAGTPTRPVVTPDGCRIATFAATAVRACPGAAPQTAQVSGDRLQLRQHGSDVVISDPASGRAVLATDGFREVTGWAQVAPQPLDDPDIAELHEETDNDTPPPPPPDCAGVPVSVPRAADDSYGVRAGRASVLRVLDNDPATDCTTVTITGVSGLPAGLGTATVVKGGSAIQLTLPAGAAGTLPPLEYQVDNGKGGTAKARVTIRVAPAAEHAEPQRLRRSVTEVEAGGTISYNVVEDYLSPTGDDLFLVSAATDSGDEVSFRPDGTITVRGTGGAGADHRVQFVISDGQLETTGNLTVAVVPPGTSTPISYPVHVRAAVGRTATADPIRAVSSGAVRPVTIGKVTAEPGTTGASATAEPGTGRILVQAAEPGSYYFNFQVTTGDRTTTGVLRADFTPADLAGPVVPMLDLAFVPRGGSVVVEPLANDTDPTGGGLALQRTSVPVGVDGLTAAVIDLHRVQLAVTRPTDPVTVPYTVFDGVQLTTGQIRVIEVPPPKRIPPPIASPISVTVRAGDAITIPVADHAAAQDGSTLSVVLDPADRAAVPGVLFSTATSIRYLAPRNPPSGPVVFGYTAVSASSTPANPVRTASTVTVTVVPADPTDNRPPTAPAPVVARVFAGGTIDVDLPLSGTDPDGDWVTAAGLVPPAAPLGRAMLHGAGSLRYTALDKPGVEALQYLLTDPLGRTATGVVNVIVVPPIGSASPPLAPDLTAAVPPGRTIRISPLVSVSDPAGIRVRLAEPAFQAPDEFRVTVDEDSLLVTAPDTETVATLRYFVVNERGLSATGAIAVTVSAQAPAPPPAAEDIVVPPTDLGAGATSVQVDIAGRVVNRTGRSSELELSVDQAFAAAASVTGPSTLTVTLADHRQVIPYRVTDAAGGTATAFLIVPPMAQLVGPQLIAGKDPVRVDAGSSVDIALADYVTVAQGEPRLAAGVPLRASQGSAVRLDDGRVRLSQPITAGGAAVLYLPIVAPDAVTAVLPLAVQVIPRVVPAPALDSTELGVEVGTVAEVDLAPLTTAFDSTQRRSLRWSADAGGRGIAASISGSVLTVSVATGVPRGTTVAIAVRVADGEGKVGTAEVTVRATGSRKPLPVVVSQRVDNVRAGQQVRVDLLAGSSDPIGEGLVVTKVSATGGAAALTAGPELVGSTVKLVPASGFSGEITVNFTVQDATRDPQRTVTGTVTVAVSDRPAAPGAPTEVSGSRTATSVQLTWAPADPRGSTVTGYTVTGGPRAVRCGADAASCRIDGLTTGVPYTFTVVAHNAVGDSPPSRPSATVVPDATPGRAAAPVAGYTARGAITVSYTVPTGAFSAVQTIELQEIVDGTPGRVLRDPESPSRITGLDPGRSYAYRVRAINREGAGGWSAPSAAVVPSGVPGAPAVQVSYRYDGANGQLMVSWAPPADSGGQQITGYQVLVGGGQVATTAGDVRTATAPARGTGEQTVEVRAVNPRGAGPAGSATVVVFTRPATLDQPTLAPADRALVITVPQGLTPGSSVGRYDYRINEGPWTQAGSSRTITTPATLTNGTEYRISVRVCNTAAGFTEAATCSAPSPVATGTPYGPIGKPTITATVARDMARFEWEWPDANGRVIASRTVVVDERSLREADVASGVWETPLSEDKPITAKATFCVAVPGDPDKPECTDATAIVTIHTMKLRRATCGLPAPTGGAWIVDQQECLRGGGKWVEPGLLSGGTVDVSSCVKGQAYPADPPPTSLPSPQPTEFYLGIDSLYYRQQAFLNTELGPSCE